MTTDKRQDQERRAWKLYRNRLMTLQNDAYVNLTNAVRELADDPMLGATPLTEHIRMMAVQRKIIMNLLDHTKEKTDSSAFHFVKFLLNNELRESSMEFVRNHDRATEDKIRIVYDLLKLADSARQEAFTGETA